MLLVVVVAVVGVAATDTMALLDISIASGSGEMTKYEKE
jgi:hypothetical protein